jgi:hypothetical protein
MKTLILTDEECELLSLVFSDWLDWKKRDHNRASDMLDVLDRFFGDFIASKCSESTQQSFQETKDARQKSEQTISTGESIVLKLKTLSTAN